MRHVFITRDCIRDDQATITGSEARHVGRVLRRGVGDPLSLVDERGCEYRSVITARDSRTIEARITDRYPPRSEASTRITLGQALPRARKMDLIVQKATELGVSTIIPFISDRTVVRLDGGQGESKCLRWRKIACEAAKQCGRRTVPGVEGVVSLAELIERGNDNSLKLLLWEDEKHNRLRNALKTLRQIGNVLILIGPEGGFAPPEVAAAALHGFTPVGLGRIVLRTETAGLYVLSIIHYELGES